MGLAFGLLLDLIWFLTLLVEVNVFKVDTVVTMRFEAGRGPYVDDHHGKFAVMGVVFLALCILVAGFFAAFLSRSVLASAIAGACLALTTTPGMLLPLFRAIFSEDRISRH